MAKRTFKTTAQVDAVGPEFDLEGVWLYGDSKGEPWTESFRCVAEPPGGVLDDLATGITADEAGNRVYNAPSLVSFVRGVLVPEDEQRFVALAHDKARSVKLDLIGEIVMWLAEELFERPTGPASS